MKTAELLISLIKSEITSEKTIENRDFKIDEVALYRLAKMHDLSHFLLGGLKRNEITIDDPEISKKIKTDAMLAVYRYERQNAEFERLCSALGGAKIPFIPLKGSVIRNLYPEPWMRTSCDIDILVHKDDLQGVVNYLVKTLDYKKDVEGSHDITLISCSGVHIELHFDTIEVSRAKMSNKVLENVWDYAYETTDNLYNFSDDMFYFYHIAHMAKHIENGGCGIRPFIDLFLLNRKRGQVKSDLIEKAGLSTFEKVCVELSEYWFNDGTKNDELTLLENYVLSGGVYGSTTNAILLNQQKSGGKAKYVLSKIFVPYEVLKFKYPVLKRHKWLLPIMEVRRWFAALFRGRIGTRVKELEVAKNTSEEKTDNIKKLFKVLDL